jgi:rod shape-determining protein MreC
VLCAVIVAIPALFLRANLRSPAHLNVLDRGVLRASSPLQAAMSAGIRGVVGVWDGYVALVHAKRDNRALLVENARLREEAARARREAAAAVRYEKLLGLRAEIPTRTVAAQIIGTDASPHFRVVRVRVASGAGASLRRDMAVLATEGLVGRVRRTYGDYADVHLAVDPAATFDAVVVRTGAHCLLDGDPGHNRFRCRIETGSAGDDVKVGDLLVTSQLNLGVPHDVTIGRVSAVESSRGTVHRDATVTPAVDFSRLSEVLILLEEPPPRPPESQPAPRRTSPRGLLR